MNDIVLTDALVKAATVPDGKREVYLREAGGLALRVRASGSKAFYFLHTRPGMKGTHKSFIGKPHKRFKVADAHKRARILAGQHAQGVDLIVQRREQKAAARRAAKASAVTVGALLAEGGPYEASLTPRRSPRSGTELRQHNRFRCRIKRPSMAAHPGRGWRVFLLGTGRTFVKGEDRWKRMILSGAFLTAGLSVRPSRA